MNRTYFGNRFNLYFLWMLLICLLSLAACGGGTAGTGLNVTASFEGRILLTSGEPAQNIEVTNTETGDSTVTDSNGHFALTTQVDPENPEVQLSLKGDTIDTEITVTPSTQDESRTTIDISIDPEENTASVTNFDVKAEIVGACDIYFENGVIIRQANKTPQGVNCTAKVTVLADGVPKGGIPVAIQYKSCVKSDDWDTITTAVTSPDAHHGIAQLNFKYFDSRDYCHYRIIAPFEYGKFEPVIFPIETFTAQNLPD